MNEGSSILGALVLAAAVWVVGAAAYVLHTISSLDWAASIVIPIVVIVASVWIGALSESKEAKLVTELFPAWGVGSSLVVWLVLAYTLNHQIPAGRYSFDPATTFGFWMAMGAPFVTAFGIFVDRLGLNAFILKRWGPNPSAGGGGSGPSDPTGGDGDDDFGIEPPVVDPTIIEMIKRAVTPQSS